MLPSPMKGHVFTYFCDKGKLIGLEGRWGLPAVFGNDQYVM